MNNSFLRAVNPHQYDLNDLNWMKTNSKNYYFKEFEYFFLSKFESLWKGNILDIGCGTGWLLGKIRGRKRHVFLEGIEPSLNNFNFARKNNSSIIFYNTNFESFVPCKKYDLIISAMVFSHFSDLNFVFGKIASMLKKGGELHIIIPNYEFHRRHDKDKKISFKKLNDKEYSIIFKRRAGVIADIVRKNEVYFQAAEKNNLKILENIPMVFTESFLKKFPEELEVGNIPMNLFRFGKQD